MQLEQCKQSYEDKMKTCATNRASDLELLHKRNAELEAELKTLQEEEHQVSAKLATCNKK